ncbi:unnamed protein product [Effrenium voratum]|uniref:Uncharacterized protein n=1 Tax=Effrenium voratum TaxID=2562239 RepID=A0AA36JAN8_9DINO|nr:unnamed protein product [Effrenium voratum]
MSLEDAKVSRIRAPRKDLPQSLWRSPQKRLFLAPAIERTLRSRQALQPLAARSVPSLRLKTPEPPADLYIDTLTKPNVECWNQEPWLNILTEKNRVDIPFNEIRETSHGEEYIQWYEDQRAQKRAATPSGRKGSLKPISHWRAALADFALGSLQPSKGEFALIQQRALLLRHLETKALNPGLAALAEAVAFRFGGQEKARLGLAKIFGETLSLLDLAVLCSASDLDLSLLCGEDLDVVLAHLLPPGCQGADVNILLSPGSEELGRRAPVDFQRLQAKWYLLGAFLGLAKGEAEASEKDRLNAQLKHLELRLKPWFFYAIEPDSPGPGARAMSSDAFGKFFEDANAVDAAWAKKLDPAAVQEAFQKASEAAETSQTASQTSLPDGGSAKEGLCFESFKRALKLLATAVAPSIVSALSDC